jgi:ABC-type antimicrobial peptide transport system permease subunit
MLILFIACINFMNLSTAQSQKRAKEVGVRKVTGAGRISLIGQFLCESVVLASIAGLFALILVQWSLPFLNQIIDKSLTLHFENPSLWLSLVAFIVFTGLLAGSYPAFFLSRFRPAAVLKAGKENKNPFTLRKILVVTQFSAATILIVCTLVVYRQINYVQNRGAGYNMGHLLDVPIEGSIRKNYAVIKTDLLNSGAVAAICKNSLGVTVDGRRQAGYIWEGSTQDQQNNLLFSRTGTDGDFVKTMGLKLLAGRDIDFAEYPADSASALLNETAVKEMGIKNPVGNYIKEGNQTYTIAGVFKDFIIGSPYDVIKPMIVVGTRSWVYHIIMRLNEKNGLSKDLRTVEQVFKKYNPAYPFTYHFVDEQYEQNFSEQKQTGALAALFAGLTIFISCLGLFGLAAYVAESRSKEIGVRKVLGASVSGIVAMLSKNFAKLVVVASVIAFPVAWWAMNKWLQSFAYRIDIGWWVFVAAGSTALVIALATVSFHATRAAIANPVKSLRTE